MYSRALLIQDKDTAQSVIDKLAIQLKTLGSKVISRKFFVVVFESWKYALFLEPDDIQLYRYEDPVLGPRTLPQLDQPTEGKILIPPSTVFRCDFENNALFLEIGGKRVPLGRSIVYIVKLPSAPSES